jgi:hypothetical protein
MSQQKVWLKWSYDSIVWGNNPYIWSEVYILINVGMEYGGGGGMVLNPAKPWKDLDKQLKQKKFTAKDRAKLLELVVRVNGLVKSEVREIDDSVEKRITIDHIKNTLAPVIRNITVAADVKKK